MKTGKTKTATSTIVFHSQEYEYSIRISKNGGTPRDAKVAIDYVLKHENIHGWYAKKDAVSVDQDLDLVKL